MLHVAPQLGKECGVTAYGVAQHTAEIGVRMAIGADGLKVVKMIVEGAIVQMEAVGDAEAEGEFARKMSQLPEGMEGTG